MLEASSKASKTGAGRKILIVEDEAIVAEDIAHCLQQMGYIVTNIVASGEQAIANARTTHPQLVLMDIMLRGRKDGIAAAQQIRDELNIPVIYLTANADNTTLQRAKLTEPFGYILKPFKERELQAAIEIALSRHQAELEVQQALALSESRRQAAEQMSKEKSSYLSMASHEFRTPLAVIKLSASILQSYSTQLTDDKKQHHLRRIEEATNNMNQILEDVLALGQADAGRMEFEPAPINVSSFCKELIDAFQWSVNEQCQLQLVCNEPNLEANLDHKLLWHLLNNLVTNAIKYSPKGGEITLTLSCEASTLCIAVQDQGIGIPSEDHNKLFDPFHRAKNVGAIPGTGLGLAIAKHAVDLHQGEIQVESALGQGTTFIVKLPLCPSTAE